MRPFVTAVMLLLNKTTEEESLVFALTNHELQLFETYSLLQ